MALIFPKWTNEIPKIAPPVGAVVTAFAIFVVWFWFSPKHTDVGYQPHQPIPYSHKLHAGDLGMDCRYCHFNVERAAVAGVPPTQTCMNCHSQVKTESKRLIPLYESWKSGEPVHWLRIHKIADYAYFDHSVHMNIAGQKAAVGCVQCHGRIDQMPIVRQAKPLSMGWCLECHRTVRDGRDYGLNVDEVLRPRSAITDMTWKADATWSQQATEIAKGLKPPTIECSGCHR
jgi:hypothetical protein